MAHNFDIKKSDYDHFYYNKKIKINIKKNVTRNILNNEICKKIINIK